MIRRPPRSTQSRSSAASDVYKRQIHDREHDRKDEQNYSDRFNRRIVLQPGAQQVRISLQEVKSAPATREMDMEHVVNINVFAYMLKEERVVFFDNFRLQN